MAITPATRPGRTLCWTLALCGLLLFLPALAAAADGDTAVAAAGDTTAAEGGLSWLGIIGIGLGLFAVGIIVAYALREKQSPTYRRLREISGPKVREKRASLSLQNELEGTFYQRVIEPIINRIAKKFTKNDKNASANRLQDMLIAAGNPGDLGPGEFRAVQFLCAAVSMTAVLVLGLIASAFLGPGAVAIAVGGMAIAGGFSFIIPQFWLKSRITGRTKQIQKTLPDAIDLLVVSVEAGLGFDMAMGKVVEKTRGALSDEFARVLEEMRLGFPRQQALKNVTRRVQNDDLNSFISAIIQADQLGTSVGTVLRIQSEQMRVKRKQRIEEAAMKAPIKMLFPMVLFIFPTIFIIILGPIVIKVKYAKEHIGEETEEATAAPAAEAAPAE